MNKLKERLRLIPNINLGHLQVHTNEHLYFQTHRATHMQTHTQTHTHGSKNKFVKRTRTESYISMHSCSPTFNIPSITVSKVNKKAGDTSWERWSLIEITI